jgi:hypothetical protein
MLGDRVAVVVIPNAGHTLAPEQPQAIADAIATFARVFLLTRIGEPASAYIMALHLMI